VARTDILAVSLVVCHLMHAGVEARSPVFPAPPTSAHPSLQAAGATTGALVGHVTDVTGGVLPDVTIEVSSDALMGLRSTRTGPDGSYRLPALPPGEYRLAFSREGFTTASHEGIHVALGFTATVDVELQVAALSDAVLVPRPAILFDTLSAAAATSFTARQLADLPSARTMWALQAFTPGVRLGTVDVGGSAAATPSVTIAYGTAGLNRPTVEGITVTGINFTGFTLDYGSFDEASVATAAHGPEWHTPGVHVQFISKSGGNRYRGTIYADYEHRAWQSYNIDEGQVGRGVSGGAALAPRETNRLWRYHDVNGDVGGYVSKDRLWWYASVRHQEIASRRVNFPAETHRTFLTNYTGKVTSQLTPSHRLVAFGQVGRNHQPTGLDPFGPGGSGLTAATAINASRDSTTEERATGWVGKAEWNAVAGDQWLFEVRAGQFGANRRDRPNGAGPRFEDLGTPLVSGASRDWERRFHRTQLLGSVSRFRGGRGGRHHLKVGGEIFLTTDTESWRSGYGEDVLHVLRNGRPLEVYLFQTPSQSTSGLWTYSAYASDAWQLNRRVTLTLGLRVDRYRAFLPEQSHPAGRFNAEPQIFPAVDHVIAWNVVAPRVGAIHDLSGDGRTLFKLTYGRYWIAPGTQLGSMVNPNATVWWRRYEWFDPDGSGRWEPGEEGRELGRRGGVATESLDPALQLPLLSEAGAWIERELAARIGLRAGIVWRGSRRHFSRQNVNQPFEAFTVPVPITDPGPDGLSGTADDGPPVQAHNLAPEFAGLPAVHIVRNVPDVEEHHWTWDITATRRASGRWSLAGGFSHTWHREHAGGYLGQSVRNNVYPLTPNDLINTGPNGHHAFTTWTAKAYGTYEAPWALRVTPLLRHQSGQPYGRTILTNALNYGSVRVLAEPIGARRMDHITLVDVRAEKGIRLAGGRRVAAFVDVFNLLNANPELNVSWASGPAFLRPLTILPPRIARVGTKVEW
jgi:hypothetical protein